ncbi:MAG TPA: hypothetical protein VFH78_13355 [Candidatus Thermoplasmatota archaeon]|nr:hypothetical protein [Candidatus Thermoplasmatota archaeon]
MDEPRDERRAPKTEQPESNVPSMREDDPYATPLGARTEDPGAVRGTSPLSGGPSIRGQRGHGTLSQSGGPTGLLDKENADARQRTRDDPPVGHASSPNDESA